MKKVFMCFLIVCLWSCSKSNPEQPNPVAPAVEQYSIKIKPFCDNSLEEECCTNKADYETAKNMITSSSAPCKYLVFKNTDNVEKKGYLVSVRIGSCN
jgi:hypothetical protein